MAAGPHPGPFDGLADATYVQLTTFRRAGEAVPTPVWPVWPATPDGRIYAVTGGASGKVKRIRANSQVRLAPCTSRGVVVGSSTVEGRARVMTIEEAAWARSARRRVHPVLGRLFGLYYRVRGEDEIAIEISPAQPPVQPPAQPGGDHPPEPTT